MPPGGVIRSTALLDIVVSLVAVPLLVIFSILLESNMRSGDWTTDDDRRWDVFGLGLALLLVSLAVCCYVIHRLGICFWKARTRGQLASMQTTSATGAGGNSQLSLVSGSGSGSGGELPPSYDSVVDPSPPPPPYYLVMPHLVAPADADADAVKGPTASLAVHDCR